MKIRKKSGVTLIEAMAAMVLLGMASVGFLQMEKKKQEQEIKEEFQYDLTKVFKGFDDKLSIDGLVKKEYWKSENFKNDTFQNHLKKNLIAKKSKCSKSNIDHAEMPRSYIPCYMGLKTSFFKVKVEGDIEFFKNEDFKKYELRFMPDTEKDIGRLQLLSRLLKRSLMDVNLYSDVSFMVKDVSTYEEGTFTQCLNARSCYLKTTFGTTYNYLEPEKEKVKEESPTVMVSITNGSMLDYSPSDYSKDKDETKNIKDTFSDYGIKVSKKEKQQIEKTVERLKNDKEFVRQIEEKLKMECNQYDDDDYYFMSLYKKNHPCYIYKTKGLHGEIE